MNPEEQTDTTLVDDDAGFDDGFTANAPTETPEQGNENADDKPEAPPPEYVQLTKAELEELKAHVALIDEIKAAQDKGFGTAFGKLGGFERDMQAIKAGKRIEIKQEDIDALKDDFAPMAAALEKVRDMQVIHAGAGTVDNEAIDRMVQERMAPALASIGTTVEQAVEKRLLAKVHPDWNEFQTSEAFAAWAQAQPEDYRTKLASTWDHEFIADAMTKAKAAAKKAATTTAEPDDASTRRNRMNAAVTPRGSGGTPATDSTDDFDAGFNGP